MAEQGCFHQIDSSGIATITLNRPEVHNALDGPTVLALTQFLCDLKEQSSVRSIMLTSVGKSFCVGVDLNWMRCTENDSEGEDAQVGQTLGELMQTLYTHPKPTIALVQGATFGGGVGLVACCDIALAAHDALFCFSEVRLGLIPAVISPYVVRAIGARMARRYFLTAEKFSAEEAYRIGLVHQILAVDQLKSFAGEISEEISAGAPCALTRVKELIDEVSTPFDSEMILKTNQWADEVRQTVEAKEGIRAFLEKRKASWLHD